MKKSCNLQTRDLIATVVEKNLLQMGKCDHDKIIRCLKKEHGCSVLDCYVKPEVLNLALKKHLGDRTESFVKLMIKDLEKINHNYETEYFLETLKQH